MHFDIAVPFANLVKYEVLPIRAYNNKNINECTHIFKYSMRYKYSDTRFFLRDDLIIYWRINNAVSVQCLRDSIQERREESNRSCSHLNHHKRRSCNGLKFMDSSPILSVIKPKNPMPLTNVIRERIPVHGSRRRSWFRDRDSIPVMETQCDR